MLTSMDIIQHIPLHPLLWVVGGHDQTKGMAKKQELASLK
jgi:hypothetical protein